MDQKVPEGEGSTWLRQLRSPGFCKLLRQQASVGARHTHSPSSPHSTGTGGRSPAPQSGWMGQRCRGVHRALGWQQWLCWEGLPSMVHTTACSTSRVDTALSSSTGSLVSRKRQARTAGGPASRQAWLHVCCAYRDPGDGCLSSTCPQVYEEGTHFMMPWFERPTIFNVRARPNVIQSTSGSRDLQMVRAWTLVLSISAPLGWALSWTCRSTLASECSRDRYQTSCQRSTGLLAQSMQSECCRPSSRCRACCACHSLRAHCQSERQPSLFCHRRRPSKASLLNTTPVNCSPCVRCAQPPCISYPWPASAPAAMHGSCRILW